jgi:molybdopterin-containing oxidoreductase family iron-sulfur binding subunit
LDLDGQSVELPVYVQPGTHDQVVAVALGYGGVATERFAGIGPSWIEARPTVGEDGRVGKNIAPFLSLEENLLRNWRPDVNVVPVGRKHPLASTQMYHKITVPEHLAPVGAERRPIVQEASFAAFKEDPHAGQIHTHDFGPEKIYPADHPKDGHHWMMAVDLTACTGCSACVIACQAENNVSVVGKDEVRRQREMHWMRIDRYYSGEGDDVDVVHQPMMCQHCDNASCENVCPVLATVHTSEGLNAQVYNRCVGTRYCANNCAYKVRRFNWFKYKRPDELENMVLNPDVTVRSRGVMEKCSFCVQRIQNAKVEAKRQGIPVSDESVQTACQQSCPAGAIVFGDINNPESRVSRMLHENPRAFRVLEEIDVDPSVHYLTQVRNSVDDDGKGDVHHG